VALGEWKVVAEPGATWGDATVNIADPLIGGHVVTTDPFSGDRDQGTRLLDEDDRRDALRLEAGPDIELVLGFQDGRAARVDALEWVDPSGSNPATRLEAVEVWASTQTPLGPWAQLGTWSLAQAVDGSVAAFTPPEGTWARYLRLTGTAPDGAREAELPAMLRVLEAATDATYRSIVAEWGEGSSRGPLEWSVPPPAVAWDPSLDAGDGEVDATPLPPGGAVTDRVQIDVDEDWFAIDVPTDTSGLVLVAEGRPTVGIALSLFDAAGEERPMAFVRQADGTVRYEARVEPGASYRLRVRQPPFSAVFTFDTSGSMGPYLDIVLQGMRTFAGEVQPGREAVMIVPFEDPPLLPTWEDDPYLLQEAVNNMAGLSASSGAEAGLLAATELLAEREGARAVLHVTDAVTGTYRLGGELWDALGAARPIVFSVHIGAADALEPARDLMQDWAASGGGHYTYPVTHGAMDRAFERMATWLRRPAVYGLQVEAINLDPGSISVSAPVDGGTVALAPGVGVEIILDTSGSMRKFLAGERRIEIAKASLDRLVEEALPEGVPIALRTFGGKGKSKLARCGTRLMQPLAPLDRAAMRQLIGRIPVQKKTGTPIAAALSRVAQDLASVTGTRSVVLVTDGDATCGGDPGEAITALREAGIDVAVNIVGFALEDEAVKERMAGWADAGGGHYFDAAGAEELVSALGAALGAPFRVYGPDGEVYEGGTVGGGTIAIDPGTYRVEVLTDPPAAFEEVVVAGGQSVVLELPSGQ
jgi:Mg-chelatase subunit ChlD